MNLPGCAFGPSVGPSQVETCAVEAATSALAASSASPPACMVITGAATVVGIAATEAVSICIRPPAPSTVPAAKPACFKKPLRVEVPITTPLVVQIVLYRTVQFAPDRSCSNACVPPLPRTACFSLLGRQRALPTARGIGCQTHRDDERRAVEQRLDEECAAELLESRDADGQDKH